MPFGVTWSETGVAGEGREGGGRVEVTFLGFQFQLYVFFPALESHFVLTSRGGWNRRGSRGSCEARAKSSKGGTKEL